MPLSDRWEKIAFSIHAPTASSKTKLGSKFKYLKIGNCQTFPMSIGIILRAQSVKYNERDV